jgi:CBS domain-containing protein
LISRANVVALLDQYGSDSDCIDLSEKVEIAPVTIPPNMPLPFIYRIVQGEGFNYVPVVRYHGCLEGLVSREGLVDIQNRRLDDFHLKDQIDRMNADLEAGQILGSMHLGDNIHAERFKDGMRDITKGMLKMMKNPVKATKNFLEEEEMKDEDQKEYFLTETHGKSVFTRPADNRQAKAPLSVEDAVAKAFIPAPECESETTSLQLEINPAKATQAPVTRALAVSEETPLLQRPTQSHQNHAAHNSDTYPVDESENLHLLQNVDR